MESLRNKYDPEFYHLKSRAFLDETTKEERLQWVRNPCTKSLMYALEGDLAGIVSAWLRGEYSSEVTADGTAQLQAKARGMAQALDDILEHIQEIKRDSTEEEETDGERPPYSY